MREISIDLSLLPRASKELNIKLQDKKITGNVFNDFVMQ